MTVRTVDSARWQQLCHATRDRLARKGALDRLGKGTLPETAPPDATQPKPGLRPAAGPR